MDLRESIKNNLEEYLALCRNHNVKRLYAFGSSVTPDFDEASSGIDLLIEMKYEDPILRGENFIRILDKYELFFQRKVDLLTNTLIRNPFFRK